MRVGPILESSRVCCRLDEFEHSIGGSVPRLSGAKRFVYSRPLGGSLAENIFDPCLIKDLAEARARIRFADLSGNLLKNCVIDWLLLRRHQFLPLTLRSRGAYQRLVKMWVFESPPAGSEFTIDTQTSDSFQMVDNHGAFHSWPLQAVIHDVYHTIPIRHRVATLPAPRLSVPH